MADDLDLEAELLMVAGRTQQNSSRNKRPRKSARDDDDDDLFGSDNDEDDSEDDERSQRKKRGQARHAEEEEDDEDDAESDDGSDLYIDEEDRKRLEAMTELQREMILSDRAEERDKQRQRKALLKSAKAGEKQSAQAASGSRASRRQRKTGEAAEKDSAIRQIQAARKRQQGKGKGKSSSGGRGKGTSKKDMSDSEEGSDAAEDDDDEAEFRLSEEESSDVEEAWHGGRGVAGRQSSLKGDGAAERHVPSQAVPPETRGTAVLQAEEEEEEGMPAGYEAAHMARYDDDEEDVDGEDASLEELKSIQVLRTQLEAWYDKPFFTGDGVSGIVVRMAYGAAAGGQQYMLFVVHDVKEGGKVYSFGPRASPCHKYLVLVDGLGNKHMMAMQNVSNSPFQDAELERYHRHCERADRKALSRLDVSEAKRKIEAAISYRWDSNVVREMLERKRASGRLPVNIAAEKGRLRRLLEEARDNGRTEEADSIEQQLRDLETRSMMSKPGQERTFGMSLINKRNMQINFNIAFKNVSNKPAGGQERKGGADPFSRRATRPNIYWNTKGSKDLAAQQAADKAAASRAASEKSLEAAQLSKKQAEMDPVDLIKQLEISIDLNLIPDRNSLQSVAKRMLGRNWHTCLKPPPDLAGKGVLSIDDWKSRAFDLAQQPQM
ncbi:hypothetical protein CEUSTIGMA_g7891.t1 [Chlamydomonas eustigma]|uniref:Plus3 domain-containing protein n=1 Tax=Chlamydomonas eustigma TaxID=1157962 RepID=A0A250XC53_9CHLO|nr:hypothetical protein CEUSTIGMA_g7891.t1 [Chlamydomonas eustigma]|eukprot:GAX80452.1 hypothetical protein CEUSTIGMA_g7891.t1 [Chlamydomonas eustigma]